MTWIYNYAFPESHIILYVSLTYSEDLTQVFSL